jgi:hypothetical protein
MELSRSGQLELNARVVGEQAMTRAAFGRRVALVAGILVLAACTMTKTFQHAIEVKRGSTIEEKLAIAMAIVTEERVVRLRRELKARLPGVTDQQLARLGLRWNEIHYGSLGDGRSGTAVAVAVGIQVDGSFDPQPIVDAAVAILEPEINSSPASNA